MKRLPQNEFDFLSIAYHRIVAHFSEEIQLGKTIEVRDINRFLGLQFSMDKKTIRKLLRSLSYKYQNIEILCHGVRIRLSS